MSPDRRPEPRKTTRRVPSGRAAAVAVLLLILAGAAPLAACGGSSGGASPGDTSPASSPSSPGGAAPTAAASGRPTPVPSPQVTTGPPPAGAVAVARRFWRLISDDRFDAARELLAPGSHMAAGWPGTDTVVRAHLVRANGPVLVKTLKADETVQFPVDVYVVPKFPVGNWDGPGTYVQYMGFVRMSDDTWRVVETGTGE